MPNAHGHLVDPDRAVAGLTGHGIIVGFGIPGRAAANLFESRGFPFCVVEMNPATVERCATAGLLILQGDAADEQVLRRAGIERAAVLALAMPNETAVLDVVALARRLSPAVRILARCRHVSTAIEAARRGANDVLSEEQVVAEAFARQVGQLVPQAAGAGRAVEP